MDLSAMSSVSPFTETNKDLTSENVLSDSAAVLARSTLGAIRPAPNPSSFNPTVNPRAYLLRAAVIRSVW
jgi:hypothetical protein